jgi:hypothetical protein
MTAEKHGFGTTEDRLVNWAGWINKLEPVDKTDAKLIDQTIRTLPEEVRQVVKAIYVQWPMQSIYFVASELRMPPAFINRSLTKAKDAINRA